MTVKICLHGSQDERLYFYLGHVLEIFRKTYARECLNDKFTLTKIIVLPYKLFLTKQTIF